MAKKKSKKNKGSKKEIEKRELLFKEDMQEYAKIIKLLGDRRLTVRYPDGKEVLAVIPGRMKKRGRSKRVMLDDVILVSKRDFQEDKVDVIHQYTTDEVKNLISYGELPGNFEKIFSEGGMEIESDTTDGFSWFGTEEEDGDEIDFDEI